MLSRSTYRVLFIAAVLSNFFTLYTLLGCHTTHPAQDQKTESHALDRVSLPPKLKVIALVFYGRKQTVEILNCYLKRNLKVNGGILDQVIFSVNTANETDLSYLTELLSTNKQYSNFTPPAKYKNQRNVGQWAAVKDPEAVYVKIDDDVVFIEEGAIEKVVKRLVSKQEYFAVSANVVNNPGLSWLHWKLGVGLPFWPEMVAPSMPHPKSWRTSELPSYNGPISGPDGFNISGDTPAPFRSHRWLPVRSKVPDNMTFPMDTLTLDPFGPGLKNWASAAQIHYSFLSHLESSLSHPFNFLSSYKFPLWDTQHTRLSINFVAIRGSDVIDAFPFTGLDDEEYVSVTRPKQLGRKIVVEGGGVVVHWAFWSQYHEWEEKSKDVGQLGWTDALGRYALFAKEKIC